jgi:hypothetical protein
VRPKETSFTRFGGYFFVIRQPPGGHMAARLRPRHQEDVRKKIQADKIILALSNHIAGKQEMSTTQIQAARILLDKSVSNAPTDTILSGGITFELKAPWMKDIAQARGWA